MPKTVWRLAVAISMPAQQTMHCADPDWAPAGASRNWQYAMHSFAWLRDLKVLGGDHARRQARKWVGSWVEKYRHWDAIAWDPVVMGQRLTALAAAA